MLTNWQKQIIIGTVLGGSSLTKPPGGKNYYLSMRSKNYLWLNYKVQELSNLFLQQSYQYRCNSVSCEELSGLHELLYDGKKRIIDKERTLYPMLDIGLAIWFLEAGGGWCGRNSKNLFFNITKLSDYTYLVIDYFQELDLICRKTTNRNRTRLIFDVESSRRFYQIIEQRIPMFMLR